MDGQTDLVVEGYQGSANTWLREVLFLAHPGIRIASHLHSAAHVRRAVRLGVPVVVVVRPPIDAIASHISRYPELFRQPRRELLRYRRFYAGVQRVRDRVLLVTFDRAVHSAESVVAEIDARFSIGLTGTSDWGADLQERVFATLDGITGGQFETVSPRPSDVRGGAIITAKAAIQGADPSLLADCEERYRRLAAMALGPARYGSSACGDETDRSTGHSA